MYCVRDDILCTHTRARMSFLCIQPKKYYFVHRRAVFFNEEAQWIYWCTCDYKRAALVDSFSHRVRSAYKDLSLPECLHIEATRFIVSEIDAIHELSPAIDFMGE